MDYINIINCLQPKIIKINIKLQSKNKCNY